jgi:hypothetical protein
VSCVKVDAGQAVLFLWAWIKLYLLVYRETIWHFESKERLTTLYVLRYGVNRVQSCLIFEIRRISTTSAMSLMPNRFKCGVNRSFRGPAYFLRCQNRQFIEFIVMLMRRPAPTGSIIKLQTKRVAYCLLWEACPVAVVWRNAEVTHTHTHTHPKKREPEATREECSLWTVPVYLSVHSTVIFKWDMALREVNMARSGSIMFVRCVARNVSNGNQGNRGGDRYWSKVPSPPPNHFDVYLDVIPWTMQMEGARTSETMV